MMTTMIIVMCVSDVHAVRDCTSPFLPINNNNYTTGKINQITLVKRKPESLNSNLYTYKYKLHYHYNYLNQLYNCLSDASHDEQEK